MPTRTTVSTDKAPAPVGGVYSQAIVCNGMVYCSGQLGVDPATKQFKGTIEERTKQCLENLSHVLAEAGSSLNNAVKVGVFLTTMDNFAAMNREYGKWFGDQKPSRTCVAVHQLPMQSDVEIECIAHLDEPGRAVESAQDSKALPIAAKVPFIGDL